MNIHDYLCLINLINLILSGKGTTVDANQLQCLKEKLQKVAIKEHV